MQSFREFLESRQQGSSRGNFKPKKDEKLSHEDEYELTRGSLLLKPYKFMDYTVKMTVHAQARTMQRRPDFDHNDMIDLHNKVIQDMLKKFRPYGYYLYYSEKQQQGYILEFSKNKEIRIITVLPRKQNKTDSRTKLIMVENHFLTHEFLLENFEYQDELSPEIIESLKQSSLIWL